MDYVDDDSAVSGSRVHEYNNFLDCTDVETDHAPFISAKPSKNTVDGFRDSTFDSGIEGSLRSRGVQSSLDSLKIRSYSLSEKGLPVGVATTDYTNDPCKLISSTSDYFSGDLQSTSDLFWKLQLDDNVNKDERQISPSHGTCLVTSEVEEVYGTDDDGDTQLHMSIIQGIEHLASFFINMVPNAEYLNIQNILQQAPLHLAVITNQPTIVRRLMVGGADVDTKDNRGNTPLHIACIEGYEAIISHLVNPIQYQETSQNEYKITYQKIPQDLEAKNYDGQCCLHLAAQKTYLSAIRILLTKGANINAQDGKSGRTILHYAAESGNRILLKLLLAYPALNLDAETYGGETALVLARGRRYTDIVNILKERGARYDSEEEESSEEEMTDVIYDDFHVNGEPFSFT